MRHQTLTDPDRPYASEALSVRCFVTASCRVCQWMLAQGGILLSVETLTVPGLASRLDCRAPDPFPRIQAFRYIRLTFRIVGQLLSALNRCLAHELASASLYSVATGLVPSR